MALTHDPKCIVPKSSKRAIRHLLYNQFSLIPVIYPRKKYEFAEKNIQPGPLPDIFRDNYKLREWYSIVENFKKMMNHWGYFKFIRYKIEIFFNIAKNSINLKGNHSIRKPVSKKSLPFNIFD